MGAGAAVITYAEHIEAARVSFCERWGVENPADADDPAALLDWCRTIGRASEQITVKREDGRFAGACPACGRTFVKKRKSQRYCGMRCMSDKG